MDPAWPSCARGAGSAHAFGKHIPEEGPHAPSDKPLPSDPRLHSPLYRGPVNREIEQANRGLWPSPDGHSQTRKLELWVSYGHGSSWRLERVALLHRLVLGQSLLHGDAERCRIVGVSDLLILLANLGRVHKEGIKASRHQ